MARFPDPGEQALGRPGRMTEGQSHWYKFTVPSSEESYTEVEAHSQKESANAEGVERRLQLHMHSRARIRHVHIRHGYRAELIPPPPTSGLEALRCTSPACSGWSGF